jgi:hypothetical protein
MSAPSFHSRRADEYRGFNHDDIWGHRAGEPNKAVICSLALARLRSDVRGDVAGSNAVGMAQKLLLFWRKPARRCWWEGVELNDVEGVEGNVKVWIRRVWTLEMVSGLDGGSSGALLTVNLERHWFAMKRRPRRCYLAFHSEAQRESVSRYSSLYQVLSRSVVDTEGGWLGLVAGRARTLYTPSRQKARNAIGSDCD